MSTVQQILVSPLRSPLRAAWGRKAGQSNPNQQPSGQPFFSADYVTVGYMLFD